MFNIGFSEFLVIGVVALLVIGPKQLPQVARVVGRLLAELRKASQDLSGGLLHATREVQSTIAETQEGIINEGRKVVDSMTDFTQEQHGGQDDHHNSQTPEEPRHGKS